MVIAWIICIILTSTDTFPNDPEAWGYNTRTDVKLYVLEQSPWFRFPYPGTHISVQPNKSLQMQLLYAELDLIEVYYNS